MATWIKVDGTQAMVTPADGKEFTLDEMQRFVDGYIEFVELNDKQVMIINKEGKLNGSEQNITATSLMNEWNPGFAQYDAIMGDVLVCSLTEAGEDVDEDWTEPEGELYNTTPGYKVIGNPSDDVLFISFDDPDDFLDFFMNGDNND